MTGAVAGERHRSPVLALVLSCHPVPTVAVTSLTTLLAAGLGMPPGRLVLLAAAVLAGQLSVGWANDLLDRDRDRASGRTDKPIARGDVSPRVVAAAAGTALGVCIVLSLALGPAPAATHLVAVAAAWAYDLGLKRTAWSWVPYAVAFGLLPATVWLALPGQPVPPWEVVVAAALLGVGAHGANSLPDRADDLATGVYGLPQRLPITVARLGTVAALAAAVAVLVLGAPGPPGLAGLGALGAGALFVGVTAGRAGRPRDRTPFLAAVACGLLGVVILISRGVTG